MISNNMWKIILYLRDVSAVDIGRDGSGPFAETAETTRLFTASCGPCHQTSVSCSGASAWRTAKIWQEAAPFFYPSDVIEDRLGGILSGEKCSNNAAKV